MALVEVVGVGVADKWPRLFGGAVFFFFYEEVLMELLQGLSDLFISAVTTVVTGAPYVVYLMVGAFICAVIFNMVYAFGGGR